MSVPVVNALSDSRVSSVVGSPLSQMRQQQRDIEKQIQKTQADKTLDAKTQQQRLEQLNLQLQDVLMRMQQEQADEAARKAGSAGDSRQAVSGPSAAPVAPSASEAQAGRSDVDKGEVSPAARFLSRLHDLEASDPARLKQVLSSAASKLREGTPPVEGSVRGDLADRLQAAADRGSLAPLSPPGAPAVSSGRNQRVSDAYGLREQRQELLGGLSGLLDEAPASA